MRNSKKIITLLCALAATCTLSAFAACNMGTAGSSSSESGSSVSSESTIFSSTSENDSVAESSVEASTSESSKEASSSTESSAQSESSSLSESSTESSVESSTSSSLEESSLQEDSSVVKESSTESSSQSESSSLESSTGSSEDESSTDQPLPAVWGEWEALSQPSCTEDGVKVRYNLNDPTETETAPIAARGHNYSENNGTCTVCGDQVVIPSLNENQEFPLAEPCIHTDEEIYNGLCNCAYSGRGEEYSRLELTEGCYTVETIKNLEVNNMIWLSFSVKEAGQYMLYSVDNNGAATATRHDASMAYVSPVGYEARVDDNGDFYSYVSCSEQYFNQEWRATFCIKAKAGTLVKIYFVKISDPVWQPKSVYTYVYPTQINGQKAPEGGATNKKTEVPYDSKYYYSDPATGGDGYYHLETGEIIFAALNSAPERLLANGIFTAIHREGSALNLPNGYTADGDYRILNYVPFLMNCLYDDNIFAEDENGVYLTDPNKNCYQNYCNSDGLYPVNAEIFAFLNLYVQKNQPIDTAVTNEDWENQEDWLWLSACYYYTPITEGTEANPLVLTVGEYELTLPASDFYFCTIKEEGTYKITCSDSEVFIGDNLDVGETTIIVTADSPLVFTFASMDSKTVTITVEKIEK